MTRTSLSKINRARTLIALGASNRLIMAEVRIAERTLRRLDDQNHRPRGRMHRCPGCGATIVTPDCLGCRLLASQRGAA